MAIFLIAPLEQDSSKLDEKIKKEFAESDRYLLRNGRDWLISSRDTSMAISEKLGVKKLEDKNESSAALIVYVSSYWGLGNSDMWEWLDVNMEK